MWDEGEAYSFLVDTAEKDYPYPLKYLKGTWQVEELSEQRTKIVMIFEFAYTRKIYNVFIYPFMKPQFMSMGSELLDNWQEQLEMP